jgi:hypothetical protein
MNKDLGEYDMPQKSGVSAAKEVSLEERKVKALEKIAFNVEVLADAVDNFEQGEWPERLAWYGYLIQKNYLPDVKDE